MSGLHRFIKSPQLELSKKELQVFSSILETFIPRLSEDKEDELVEKYRKTHDEQKVREFCRFSGTSVDSVKIALAAVDRTVPPKKRIELQRGLYVLSTLPGMLLLTGYYQYFHNLTQAQREKVILDWRDSSISIKRGLFLSFSGLASLTYEEHLAGLEDLLHYNLKLNEVCQNLPERLPMMEPGEDMSFDAIVIGSGAGGGVVASQLAKAGQSVLVIEKGKYYHESEFVHGGQHGWVNLYEFGGVNFSDGYVGNLAGSVFGGGTTINWGACLKLQHYVREEWAKEGLDHFLSPKFSKDLDKVFERIGASTEGIVHSGVNKILLEGCRALGYPIEEISQNTGGKRHSCPFCFSGCREGIKNGTTNTWLRDAQEHGAKFLDRTKVKRVIIKNGKAVGIECQVGDEKTLVIKAQRVIVSAGTFQSPGILKCSGLRNKNIGQHLRLHPCINVFGYFDRKIRIFEGSILTSMSTVVENENNDGNGCKLEGTSYQPGLYALAVPWRGSAEHKETMLRMEYATGIIILSRDKDAEGSVQYDDYGNVLVQYTLSQREQDSLVKATLRAADIIVAAGGREIQTAQVGMPPFVFKSGEESRVDNSRFIDWKTKVKRHGLPYNGVVPIAGHQMGTNRMGTSPKTSVVKPTGETWEVENLYVADGSIFPSASAVNPMVTIQAISLHIADCILSKAL